MALFLSFESTQKSLTAALFDGALLVAQHRETYTDTPVNRARSEDLPPLLSEILQNYGAGWRDCRAFICATGPANFMQTRSAVAFARGLSLATDIPSIGVSAFETMAWKAPRPLLCALPAFSGMIYTKVFTQDEGEEENSCKSNMLEPSLIAYEALPSRIKSYDARIRPKWVVSSCDDTCKAIANSTNLHPYMAHSLAVATNVEIARDRLHRHKQNPPSSLLRPSPLYVQSPAAIRHFDTPQLID